jgi:hypothetical protein
MVSDAIPFVSQTCEAGGSALGPTVPAGNAILKCGLLAPAPWRRTNRRRIDYSGALAQFDDVLTQAADLEEAPALWARPLDQLRADESEGGRRQGTQRQRRERAFKFPLVGLTIGIRAVARQRAGRTRICRAFRAVRSLLDRGRAPRNSSRPGAERLDPLACQFAACCAAESARPSSCPSRSIVHG